MSTRKICVATVNDVKCDNTVKEGSGFCKDHQILWRNKLKLKNVLDKDLIDEEYDGPEDDDYTDDYTYKWEEYKTDEDILDKVHTLLCEWIEESKFAEMVTTQKIVTAKELIEHYNKGDCT